MGAMLEAVDGELPVLDEGHVVVLEEDDALRVLDNSACVRCKKEFRLHIYNGKRQIQKS